MLIHRIITALLGLPLLLYLTYVGGLPFLSAVLVLTLLAGLEFFRALRERVSRLHRLGGLLSALLFVLVAYLSTDTGGTDQPLYFLTVAVMALLLIISLFLSREKLLESAGITLLGALYVGGLMSFLILLRTRFSEHAVYTAYLAAWMYDTSAYFIGIRWGRNRPLPNISPNKSTEGAVGGTVGTMLGLIVYTFFSGLQFPAALLIGLATGMFAPLGDLVASGVKRELELKDFGGLLPGHGGVLDRFDSLIFVTPIIFFLYTLFGW